MRLNLSVADWEMMYAPYDDATYRAALEFLRLQDTVLDIGAGDLRFSRQMARMVQKVYAVEINDLVLQRGLDSGDPLPESLIPIHADARAFDFPADVTVGLLLMRHCTHVRLYLEKLRGIGAQRLITNARWRMSVEEVDVEAERIPFEEIATGWYACWCGATGFKAGYVDAEQWSADMDKFIHEVNGCPQCKQT